MMVRKAGTVLASLGQGLRGRLVGVLSLSATEGNGPSKGATGNIGLYCHFCTKRHDLDTCRSFFDKPLADRKAFVGSKRLCFACLQSNHISKDCKHRKKCNVCGKLHPTS